MIKLLISILVAVIASFAMAQTTELSIQAFQAHDDFYGVYVTQAERVFVDDLEMMDLYKVTWEVEGQCAGTGNGGTGHACAMDQYCDYVWVDTIPKDDGSYELTDVGASCDVDLEEILKPQLKDEY